MTHRQVIVVVAVVVAVAGLSALIAYRSGVRHGSSREWEGGTPGHCVDFKQAGEHVGEQACITGRVLRVYTSRSGNTFLDFCADYRSCPFTSVIFASDRPKFGNLETLAERQVEMRGKIVSYRGQAELVISAPDQIREAP